MTRKHDGSSGLIAYRMSKLFLLPGASAAPFDRDISRKRWPPTGTSTAQEWWLITLHYITRRRSRRCLVRPFPPSFASIRELPPATPAPSCNNFIYLLNPATYVSRMINGDAEDPRASAAPQYPFVRGEPATVRFFARCGRRKKRADTPGIAIRWNQLAYISNRLSPRPHVSPFPRPLKGYLIPGDF
jgi:hypothetical protein